jgi:hypothetical protein
MNSPTHEGEVESHEKIAKYGREEERLINEKYVKKGNFTTETFFFFFVSTSPFQCQIWGAPLLTGFRAARHGNFERDLPSAL